MMVCYAKKSQLIEKDYISLKIKVLLAILTFTLSALLIVSTITSSILIKINKYNIVPYINQNVKEKNKIEENTNKEWDKILLTLEGDEKLSEKLKELNIIDKKESEILKCLEDASELSIYETIKGKSYGKATIDKLKNSKIKKNIKKEKKIRRKIRQLGAILVKPNIIEDEEQLFRITERIKFIIKLTIPKENIDDPKEWEGFFGYIKRDICARWFIDENNITRFVNTENIEKKVWEILISEMPKDAKTNIKEWEGKLIQIKERMEKHSIEISPEQSEILLSGWKEFIKKTLIEWLEELSKKNMMPKSKKQIPLSNLLKKKYENKNLLVYSDKKNIAFLNSISNAIFNHFFKQVKKSDKKKLDPILQLFPQIKSIIIVSIIFTILLISNIFCVTIILINETNYKKSITNFEDQLNISPRNKNKQLVIKSITIVCTIILILVIIVLLATIFSVIKLKTTIEN